MNHEVSLPTQFREVVEATRHRSRLVPIMSRWVVLAWFVFGSLAAAQSTTVTISTGEWAPFVSENLEHYGIAPRIITAALEEVGITPQYRFSPWARAMKEAEEQVVEFSGIWFYNEERAQRFRYSEPVVSSANVFFYRKDRPFDWDDFTRFPDQVVGITRNYSYGQVFDEAAEVGLVQTEVTGSDILNFRKLLRGRIDAFPIGELVGYDLLRREFNAFEREMIEVHPKEISDAPLHLITAHDNTEGLALLERFNEGMAALRDNGELQRILDEYR